MLGGRWIKGQQLQHTKRAWKKGKGLANTGFGGGSRISHDDKLSVHRFGPAEFSSGMTLVERGDSNEITGTVSAFAGTTPSAGISPGVSIDVNLSASYSLELSSSSTPLNSGEQIIWAVKIYPWRLGVWIRDVYQLTVP